MGEYKEKPLEQKNKLKYSSLDSAIVSEEKNIIPVSKRMSPLCRLTKADFQYGGRLLRKVKQTKGLFH